MLIQLLPIPISRTVLLQVTDESGLQAVFVYDDLYQRASPYSWRFLSVLQTCLEKLC